MRTNFSFVLLDSFFNTLKPGNYYPKLSLNKVEWTRKLRWVMLCSWQNKYALVTVWMDRLSNNIVCSMVLSLSENIVCHFIMPLYSLWVIFNKFPRFLKRGNMKGQTDERTEWHRHFLSCSLQLKTKLNDKILQGSLQTQKYFESIIF